MEHDEIMRRLEAPFPQEAIKSRPGGGNRSFSYIEAHTAIRRVNYATGNQWDMRIVTDPHMVGDVWQCKVGITIAGSYREHIGVYKPRGQNEGEDLIKGVVSDAIKKCLTLFGVGLDLYGPDYEQDQQLSAQADYNQDRTLTREQAINAKPAGGSAGKYGDNAEDATRKAQMNGFIQKFVTVARQNGGMDYVETDESMDEEARKMITKANRRDFIKLLDRWVDRGDESGKWPNSPEVVEFALQQYLKSLEK